MKMQKLKGDTPLGHRLQKKADEKRDKVEIAAYLALDLEGLSEGQMQNKLLDLAEKNGKE